MKDTSMEVYTAKVEDGSFGAEALEILKYIHDHPGVTRLMISDRTGKAINSVCGRVNELLGSTPPMIKEVQKVKQRTGRSAWTLEVVE